MDKDNPNLTLAEVRQRQANAMKHALDFLGISDSPTKDMFLALWEEEKGEPCDQPLPTKRTRKGFSR